MKTYFLIQTLVDEEDDHWGNVSSLHSEDNAKISIGDWRAAFPDETYRIVKRTEEVING